MGRKTPTWVYRVLEKTTNTKAQQLGDGVEVIPIAGNNLPDPRAVLADLANRGITRVLVEAGASIAASFSTRSWRSPFLNCSIESWPCLIIF
mgnify:CR=1 FL=1